MRKTVRRAKAHGVKVGAQPSLPDLQVFGRREMKIGCEALANCLKTEVSGGKPRVIDEWTISEAIPVDYLASK
ncbi:MAG: LamB/YcsF family protein [Hyphomicrobiales bacterium]